MDKWIALVRAKLRELDLTQEKLGERVGVSQGGVGHWLNKRRQPDLETMNKVFLALGLGHLEVALVIRDRSVAVQLPAERDGQAYDTTSAFRYPVSDWRSVVRTREPGTDDEVAQYYEVADHYASGAAFWLKVAGDAMTAPLGISVPEGMLILVDPDLQAEPGKLVVARLRDSEEAIFRQWVQEGGQDYLKPLNPTYPKILFTDDYSIIGVVVQATAKF
ncbi:MULTISPECIES: LexA family protein [Pseudomonas]|uniref:SOS response transcriptional repressor, RecA-mediated autopeptidase n=1 Tax=Pseudomonas asplenii TaxID=53407 RepID=A0A0M9GG81_9PSED|nr:LexA family transcriptional regulator [Pseudomonas fuscovaginae]KPA90431.1 SOS response transcriptional repressor, RecA-mediated autopeptidase [Pseudomonas fuscovaginae]KPA95191.1 SOS response transcriptional repressor, RecA-mediated autopeptidase [Pseudomonas fuscovaginae]